MRQGGQRPDQVLWTNVVMGIVIAVLGAAATGLLVSTTANQHRSQAMSAQH